MKVIAFIQARIDSTRLNRKVLLDLAGEPMLVRVVNRVLRARRVDKVVVVTTLSPLDDEIESLCISRGWSCFRGSEQDVLDRYYQAAKSYRAEVVVRVTSDCPLIEPTLIDAVLERLEFQQCDYASNVTRRTYPRGLDVEAFTFAALEKAWLADQNPALREHVTQFIARHPEQFSITNVSNDEDYSYLRWTVDTPEDFAFVEKIYTHFRGDDFSWEDVLAALKHNPKWAKINEHIEQKAVLAGGTRECLIIRTDVSARIGAGYGMRCLALAQAWIKTHGRVIFIMKEFTPAFATLLEEAGIEMIHLEAEPFGEDDAIETSVLAASNCGRWVVMDGYAFTAGYQGKLRERGAHVVCLDDDGCHRHYEADLIVNQHASANEQLYADRAPRAYALLGPRYALLRAQFIQCSISRRSISKVAHKILVTLGGADPSNVTKTVIDALAMIEDAQFEAIVVISGSNPDGNSLADAANRSRARIKLIRDAPNMPDLMAWADLAISGGGCTTLELAYMGAPMLLLVLADNQLAVAEQLDRRGEARCLGWAHNLSVETLSRAIRDLMFDLKARERLSYYASRLVDGHGAERIAQILRVLPLHLRPVALSDARLLFDWANDPEVRAVSFYSTTIPWPDHERWLRQKLSSTNAVLLIAATDADEPVGVARFEIDDGLATISVSVAAAFRGIGCGRLLIKESSRQILLRPGIRAIRALIKCENTASVRAFQAAGYREEKRPGVRDFRQFMLTASGS